MSAPRFLPLLCLFRLLIADTLTLRQAVELGLNHNFSIRIARNNTEKNYNNRKLKVGVLLPTARIDGSTATSTTYYQASGVQSASASASETKASAVLNWTLFDGFKMFYTGVQIDQRIEQSELATRLEIESAVAAIMTAYHQLIARRAMLDAAQQQLALSRAQLSFINAQYEYGRVGRRELLHQQVIVNADSSQVLSRRFEAVSALHTLNIAIGRSPETPAVLVDDSIVNCPKQDASYWYEEALKRNTGLKIAQIKKLIAGTQLAMARSAMWPVIAAGASATVTDLDPGDDYLRARGEITVSVPLFSGFSRITSVKNAVIDTLNEELSIEKQRLELKSLIYEQWERLRTSCDQIGFEKEAIEHAEKSLELGIEQFRMGRISDIQLREAQLALINARVRLQSALFQNRVVMIQLKQLSGHLKVE